MADRTLSLRCSLTRCAARRLSPHWRPRPPSGSLRSARDAPPKASFQQPVSGRGPTCTSGTPRSSHALPEALWSDSPGAAP
eukprot:8914173-Alexandrium_andersonii.AAC.1